MRSSLTAALLVAVGCFAPDLGDGVIACGAGGLCPPSYFCRGDGHCWKTGDAGVVVIDMGTSADFAGCVKATCTRPMCGSLPDNCGANIDCGCEGDESCGYLTAGVCGCATQVACSGNCGIAPNGCNATTTCGSSLGCPSGQTCGAGGPNVCGVGSCTRKTTCARTDCGVVSDGCGGVLPCPMACMGMRKCVMGTCQ
jgi:hypothetical protein